MRCGYHEAGRCGSCTLLHLPYPEQLAGKQARCEQALGGLGPLRWLDPVGSAQQGFRNKAKLVVAGRRGRPTLGILDGAGRGVDLRRCALYEQPVAEALEPLADWVAEAGLTPYDVPARRGELKHLLLTGAPDGGLMLRLVLRSTDQLVLVRRALPGLRARLPQLRVLSANIHPEHKAVLEGEQEIVLTRARHLAFPLPELTLQLSPRAFLQTNTGVAARLYGHAREWVGQAAPERVWDLYCGVGGFALHVAAPGRVVTGIEITAEAIGAARRAARALPAPTAAGVRFETGDATGWAGGAADLVIVNPPRRGLGPELAAALDASAVPRVLYSSCNVDTLARDLAAMGALRPVRARVFDMFPNTAHQEVLVELVRG